MFVLDTDTLTHLFLGHEQVTLRVRGATRSVVITLISRIEMLRGRFDSVMKAEDGAKLSAALNRLIQTEADLQTIRLLPITEAVAKEFDRLRLMKRIKKIGRADLLIASVVLVHKATLVTRNRKDFESVPGLAIENWVD